MNSVFDQSRLAVLAPATGRRHLIEAEVLSLHDLHAAGLLRYAISFGLAVVDAEDVVQETFFALYKHLVEDRPRDNLRSWLFRVTHNLALKRRASHRYEVGATEEHPLDYTDPAPSPEASFLFTERQRRLQRVIDAMPQVDRSCLRLRAEGMRYREIAQVLGISLGSVASSIARALERLERSEGSHERC